ncbi:MAG: HAD family acid phosphatase, partial [Dokdonella sp.]
QNLRSEGFPVRDDEKVFLGLGAEVQGCQSRGTDKGCRRQLIARNYRVLMQFGDQIGDFLNVHPNTVIGRQGLMQPYSSWIGERWFVLPNPTYGSWEPALFGNDWKLSVEERRRAKADALRLK